MTRHLRVRPAGAAARAPRPRREAPCPWALGNVERTVRMQRAGAQAQACAQGATHTTAMNSRESKEALVMSQLCLEHTRLEARRELLSVEVPG